MLFDTDYPVDSAVSIFTVLVGFFNIIINYLIKDEGIFTEDFLNNFGKDKEPEQQQAQDDEEDE